VTAHAQKRDVDLQSAVAQQPQQLDLGVNHSRHKVDNADSEGPYVLVFGLIICDNKNPFTT
jgi:hypothetical protein